MQDRRVRERGVRECHWVISDNIFDLIVHFLPDCREQLVAIRSTAIAAQEAREVLYEQACSLVRSALEDCAREGPAGPGAAPDFVSFIRACAGMAEPRPLQAAPQRAMTRHARHCALLPKPMVRARRRMRPSVPRGSCRTMGHQGHHEAAKSAACSARAPPRVSRPNPVLTPCVVWRYDRSIQGSACLKPSNVSHRVFIDSPPTVPFVRT